MNKCIVCFEKKNLIKICNCNYYIHEKCFDKWCILNNNNCLICKKTIYLSYTKIFFKYLKSSISKIYNFYCVLSEYDLHNMIKWDEFYD